MLNLQSFFAIPALRGILGSHLFHKRCIWVFTAYTNYATQLVGWWIEQSLPGGECHFLRKQASIPSTQEIIQFANCRWGAPSRLQIGPRHSMPVLKSILFIGKQRAAFSWEHCFQGTYFRTVRKNLAGSQILTQPCYSTAGQPWQNPWKTCFLISTEKDLG